MGNLRILFFGDVVGRPGRAALKKSLAHLKKEFKADFVIINAENLSHGKGVSEPVIKEMEKIGVDAFTSGNHIFAKKREAQGLLTVENSNLLRPANYPTGTVGEGYRVFEAENGKKILIVNLIGRVFMQRNFEDPFAVAGEILKEYGLKMSDANIKVDAIIIDWHTEASSEKKALGYYLDGKVSAVLGTHTHIPTADEQVLPEGTAFMADVGMVGVYQSVLGVEKDAVVDLFLTQLPHHLEVPENEKEAEVGGALIEIDSKTGLAKSIKRIREIIKL